MLTGRLTYALAEGEVLIRGIMGSPAPASMWTGWTWRTLHVPLEMIARRFDIRRISDEAAEELIRDRPEIRIDVGDVSVSWTPRPIEASGRRALRRAQRSPDDLTLPRARRGSPRSRT
jgi:hypothetical protein